MKICYSCGQGWFRFIFSISWSDPMMIRLQIRYVICGSLGHSGEHKASLIFSLHTPSDVAVNNEVLGKHVDTLPLYITQWNKALSLQLRHNECYGVSNHQPHDCLVNRYWDTDKRKHQSSASLAFVRANHLWPVISTHKWLVARKIFPFNDVIMCSITNTAACENHKPQENHCMTKKFNISCVHYFWVNIGNYVWIFCNFFLPYTS